MPTVRVNLGLRSYDIAVTSADLAGVGPFARQRTSGVFAFLVTDEHVQPHAAVVGAALNAAGFQCNTAVLPSGEARKSLTVASQLYDRLAQIPADRKTLVVAVGGGVIGDLAGFVAATYARGLPLLMVPTTLLAMVDSSVGGKVGVNHPKAKNLIGAFHQPVGVWIDSATLCTLPDREFRSGLAEVVKYGVILDAELFSYLEVNADAILKREPESIRHIVAAAAGSRPMLSNGMNAKRPGCGPYSTTAIPLAMPSSPSPATVPCCTVKQWLSVWCVAARLAERQGLIPHELTQRQQRLLERFGLPTIAQRWPVPDLLAAMRSDKKSVAGPFTPRSPPPPRRGRLIRRHPGNRSDARSGTISVIVVTRFPVHPLHRIGSVHPFPTRSIHSLHQLLTK